MVMRAIVMGDPIWERPGVGVERPGVGGLSSTVPGPITSPGSVRRLIRRADGRHGDGGGELAQEVEVAVALERADQLSLGLVALAVQLGEQAGERRGVDIPGVGGVGL